MLIAVLAALLLSGGDDTPEPAQEPRATATAESTPEETATPEETSAPEETSTPEETATATPEETATAAPEATGEPDLARAGQLQLDGFNARQSGDYESALDLSEQALEACAGSKELNPCGYATFEKGLALNRLGRSDEAIPFLQARLNDYPDNPAEARAELKDARRKAAS